MIILNSLANAFVILQFILLEAFSGMIGVFLAMLRGIIFLGVEKRFSRVPVCVLLVFVFMQIIMVLIIWESWVSVLMFGSIVFTYGQWQKDVKVMRFTLFCTNMSVGLYSVLVGVYTGAVNEFMQMISFLLVVLRDRKKG